MENNQNSQEEKVTVTGNIAKNSKYFEANGTKKSKLEYNLASQDGDKVVWTKVNSFEEVADKLKEQIAAGLSTMTVEGKMKQSEYTNKEGVIIKENVLHVNKISNQVYKTPITDLEVRVGFEQHKIAASSGKDMKILSLYPTETGKTNTNYQSLLTGYNFNQGRDLQKGDIIVIKTGNIETGTYLKDGKQEPYSKINIKDFEIGANKNVEQVAEAKQETTQEKKTETKTSKKTGKKAEMA